MMCHIHQPRIFCSFFTQLCVWKLSHGCSVAYIKMCLIHQPWIFCTLLNNTPLTSVMDVLLLIHQCVSYIIHGCFVAYITMCLIHQPWMFCTLHNYVSHTSAMVFCSLHNNGCHTSGMDHLHLTKQCVSYIIHGCSVACTTVCLKHQPWMLCSLYTNVSTHQSLVFHSLHSNVSHTLTLDVLWLTQRYVSHNSHGCCAAYTTMCLIHQP